MACGFRRHACIIYALSAWLRAVRNNVISSGVVECNLDGSLLYCVRHLMMDGSPLHNTALFRPDLLIAWVRHYAHKYADQTWAAALLRHALWRTRRLLESSARVSKICLSACSLKGQTRHEHMQAAQAPVGLADRERIYYSNQYLRVASQK